ncbi:MAG TPA: NUDIX hydrolase [Myxococcota bacterium]|nr:NUDIX hydrolase [Myxococcota bacterium]
MHRKPILDELERYLARHGDERLMVDHVIQFVRANPDCFERSCVPGHVTGSAWILSPDRSQFLLTHHKKLGLWLQLGGHADGDPDPRAVALREAREESGMERFEWAVLGPERMPFDVDVHLIPATASEPAHLHHDLRYLLVAAPGQELSVSSESHDLRWFPVARAFEVLEDESLLRMARKAAEWLRGAGS